MYRSLLLSSALISLPLLSALAQDDTARALIVATDQATLSAPIAAQIIHMPKQAGESFAAGVPLVSFDCSAYSAARDAAQAVLAHADAKLTAAETLARQGAAGRLDAIMAKADADKAAADAAGAIAVVKHCTITAPFAGRVVDLKAHNFESVAVATPLLSIVGDRLEVSFQAPGKWLAWLQPGQTFSLKIDETDNTVAAKVTRIGGQEDAVSQTIAVYGAIDNPAGIVAGMSGTATFAHMTTVDIDAVKALPPIPADLDSPAARGTKP